MKLFDTLFNNDLINDTQLKLNEEIVALVCKQSETITTLTENNTSLLQAIITLSDRLKAVEGYVLHLHERIKALEGIKVDDSNGFPKFKI